MTNEVSPSLSYHYWMMCINGTATNPEPSVLVRGTEFDPQKEISQEDDEGHMGTATTKISSYRSNATASPQYTDKCRYREGWEDALYLLIGSDDGDGEIDVEEVATGVNKFVFCENPEAPLEPAFATLFNGFNKTQNDAYQYNDALLNSFTLSGSNTDAPTYQVAFASDFPLFHQSNKARTFTNPSVFPKSGNVRLYIAPLGTTYANLTSNMEFSCYTDWEISIEKNVENQPCAGDTFGTSTKVVGSREGSFTCNLPWNSRSKNLEYEFMGGDALTSTTTVTDQDIHKTIYLVMTGGKIGSTNYNYQTIFKIPDVVLTNVNSPQSGSDPKSLDVEANIVDNGSDSFVEVTVQTGLSSLHISNAS